MLIDKVPDHEIRAICGELLHRLKPRAEQIMRAIPEKEFTAWTRAVKDILADIGSKHEPSYESIHSDTDANLHEFLLDFVWWSREGGGAGVLACECEFGNTRHERGNPARVAEDFDKLLSFKAPLKLMIFDSYGSKAKVATTQQDVVKLLNEYLQEYRLHMAGETYVLLDTCEKPKMWKCDVVKDGRDSRLSFEEFDLAA
jgi:hypothetical protein